MGQKMPCDPVMTYRHREGVTGHNTVGVTLVTRWPHTSLHVACTSGTDPSKGENVYSSLTGPYFVLDRIDVDISCVVRDRENDVANRIWPVWRHRREAVRDQLLLQAESRCPVAPT